MARKLIVGNWKMNPMTREEALSLAKNIRRGMNRALKADIVLCPPFVFMRDVREVLGSGKAAVGAQDIFWEAAGAHTGEISGGMLKQSGARFALIGHSERRALGETDAMVNQKVKAALRSGIVPIVCVGERERDSHGYYLAAVKRQVEHAFAKVPGTALKNCIVAYEPVWAVGNADFDTASPEAAVEMAIFIKKTLADTHGPKRVKDVRILYGGSVNDKNAAAFLAEKEIAGFLIGRESLHPKKFLAIAVLAS